MDCVKNIGCFPSCNAIKFPYPALETGVHLVVFDWLGTKKTIAFEAVEGEQFYIPNYFNESSDPVFSIKQPSGLYLCWDKELEALAVCPDNCGKDCDFYRHFTLEINQTSGLDGEDIPDYTFSNKIYNIDQAVDNGDGTFTINVVGAANGDMAFDNAGNVYEFDGGFWVLKSTGGSGAHTEHFDAAPFKVDNPLTNIYGALNNTFTGNISVTDAVLGGSVIIYHNDAAEPTYDFFVETKMGSYVNNETNIIIITKTVHGYMVNVLGTNELPPIFDIAYTENQGDITLTWDAEPYIETYNIYKNSTNDFNGATFLGGTANKTYTDIGGNGEYYFVTALIGSLESSPTSIEIFDSNFLLKDDFDGSIIDSSKWVVNNSNSNLSITQNNELTLDVTGQVSGLWVDNIYSVDAFAGNKTVAFDGRKNTSTYSQWIIGFCEDVNAPFDNGVFFLRGSRPNNETDHVIRLVRENGISIVNAAENSVDFNASRFRISIVGTDVYWEVWNGLWMTLGTVFSGLNISPTKLIISNRGNDVSERGPVRFDNVVVTKERYPDEYL